MQVCRLKRKAPVNYRSAKIVLGSEQKPRLQLRLKAGAL